ncbi:MAG: hypothetical protein E6I73_16920 [Chloroflexi bacterium]|nr:MAG: hypothetical protein E6I73_16920 [Chloroflexota bacterium]
MLLGALGVIVLIGLLTRPERKPREPLYLGGFVTAKTMNAYAAAVGCPGQLFQDGHETVADAFREIRRCLARREHPLAPSAGVPE